MRKSGIDIGYFVHINFLRFAFFNIPRLLIVTVVDPLNAPRQTTEKFWEDPQQNFGGGCEAFEGQQKDNPAEASRLCPRRPLRSKGEPNPPRLGPLRQTRRPHPESDDIRSEPDSQISFVFCYRIVFTFVLHNICHHCRLPLACRFVK